MGIIEERKKRKSLYFYVSIFPMPLLLFNVGLRGVGEVCKLCQGGDWLENDRA
jgi:hypothetical protein